MNKLLTKLYYRVVPPFAAGRKPLSDYGAQLILGGFLCENVLFLNQQMRDHTSLHSADWFTLRIAMEM